ncbi:hypothetical protein C8R44DRAFT_895409 [Mycena epipterygia]|nr:hypothetical protein C8R44DRAFT_895409 [Mycena epipterygia]
MSGLPIPDPMNTSVLPGHAHQSVKCCAICLAMDCELSQCSRCKTTMYCSRKCQKEHWPTHKTSCQKIDRSGPGTTIVDTGLMGITPVVTAALSGPTFTEILKVCFALHFNLLRVPLLDKIFIGIADIAIEPVEFRDFCRIFTGQHLGDEKIRGMVQVNSFNPQTLSEAASTKSVKHMMWSIVRECEKSEGHSVGLLDLANGANRQTMSVVLTIDGSTLETVRELKPWKIKCPVTGNVREAPVNLATSLEYLNTLIRADTNNEMGLRIEMRPIDIKAIRDAGAGVDSLPALMCRDKMEREALYKAFVNWRKRNWSMSHRACLG